MKKLLTFLTLLTLSIGVGWAGEQTITFGSGSSRLVQSAGTTTVGDITVVVSSDVNFQPGHIRLTQTNSSLTFSAPEGNVITKLVFTSTAANYVVNTSASFSSGSYTTSNTTSTWIGNSNSVKLTCGGEAMRFTQVVVTYQDGGSTPTTYTVTCNDNIANGSISASPTSATEGTTITLTATPDAGYQLGSWSVKDASNNNVTVSNNQFTMPASNVTVDATFTAQPTINAIFYESFNENNNKGGRDNDFGNGSGTFSNDNNDLTWSNTSNVYSANHCIRMGTTNNDGSITSPAVGQEVEETTLSFDLAGWNSGTNTLTVTINNGGTFSDGTTTKTFTATNSTWESFTETVDNLTANTTITFSGRRFFLDEIILAKPVIADGDFYLVGSFNMEGTTWITNDPDYKFTRQTDGSYTLDVENLPDNVQFKIIKVKDGQTTWLGGDGNSNPYVINSGWHTNMSMSGGNNYSLPSAGDCYFYISPNLKLSVEKAPISIKTSLDSFASATEMTATDDGWTITLNETTLNVGDQFGFTDGWDGQWHGGDGAYILEDYLGVALDMSKNGNFVVRVPGIYTISVNKGLTKMTADVARNSHNITCVANPNGGGSVSATVSGTTATSAKYLDEVTIATTVNNGYTLNDVVVTGNTSGNEITVTDNTFTMPDEDVTVTANFTASTEYSITVVSPNGTTTCPSTATVGQTVSFTVTPDNGYTVNTVTASFEINNSTSPVTVSYNEQTGEYSFGMPPYPVTVTITYTANTGFTQKQYQLITSVSELESNKTYLIADLAEATNVLGHYDSSNNRGSVVSVTLDENDQITSTEEMEVITLGGQSGAWTLATASGNLGACSTSNGKLAYDTDQTATITFNDGEATIVFSGNYTRNVLCFNSTFFGCYQSSTGLGKVYLFKEVEDNSLKAPVISPEGGTFLNSLYPNGVTVTISPVTEGSTIHVSTDGTNYTDYTEATTITVTENTTVTAYASKNDVDSDPVSETYNFVDVILNDVQFSPIPGDYSGAQTLEMYTTTQNAKIYYIISESPISDNPTTSSTLYSSTDVINLEAGHTYYVKAIAYVGNNTSEVAEGTYTINAASTSGLNSIAELNAAQTGSTQLTMNNPMQIIYMNTWRHNGTTPEYAYVRDNTGYGLVYFGNGYYGQSSWIAEGAVQNPKICEMGDWIPGGVAKGAVQVWSDGFHNELGGKNQYNTVTGWPKTSDELQNTTIIPEEMTNANINAGWDISNTFAEAFNAAFQDYCDDHNLVPENLTDDQKNAANAYAIEQVGGYSSHIQPNNVWGHYVHLRKNTIRVTTATNPADATDATRKKYGGFVTDQSGEDLIYYDGFYNFSGYNGTPDYSNDYFQEIQNNGGTFDVYGIVGFYGPYAADAEHNYIPFEIIPIDFLSIYKPIIHMDGVDYGVDSNNPSTVTKYEQQTVTLTCATEGATIWYKTSDMEDYEAYEPGTEIVVDATTTIEAYSSIPTKYNDLMESVVNSLEINMGSIEKPVISPESIVKTVGDDPVNATITCETSDATIYFTVDGSDPKDETNENRYEYTAANIAEYLTGIDETTTVRAIAFKDNFYSAEADAKTYTFVKSNGIIYNLVTDQTQLNESSVFVIVNKANNMAVGTTQNEYNRSGDGVKFVDENTKTQVYGNDELAQFTLKKVGNNWYLQTTNSNVNGYLYVGDGNTLLTSATATDAAEATINIDADSEHQAHISFVYNYETTRYLRYWNGGQAFSTYTSETSNLPVSLYYVKATPLANIEKKGEVGEQYTVADQLIAVDYREYGENDVYLWCKDQGNVSIAKTSINEDNQVDFMKQQGAQEGDWDQSNWVILKLTGQTGLSKAIAATRDGEKIQPHYIAPATITGHYVNDQNYMIEVTDNEFTVGEAVTYTPNVYCTANFVPENLNIWGTDEDGAYTGDATINTQNYFFMNPKIEEFCTITWAKWDGSKFVVPSTSGFEGSFNIDLTFNEDKEVIDDLNNANANAEEGVEILYQFNAIIQHNTNGSGSSKAASSDIIVYPMDLTASSAIDPATAINTVETGNGEVKSVKYVNVAGIVSDTPFEGMNIVVTEYTDGSRTTTKMLKR